VAACLAGFPTTGAAKVFYSRAEALDIAFPDADRVESETHVLDEDQVRRIEALSRCSLDSKLVKVFTGFRGETVLGYAVIDVFTSPSTTSRPIAGTRSSATRACLSPCASAVTSTASSAPRSLRAPPPAACAASSPTTRS
jgi:hypothetical protein